MSLKAVTAETKSKVNSWKLEEKRESGDLTKRQRAQKFAQTPVVSAMAEPRRFSNSGGGNPVTVVPSTSGNRKPALACDAGGTVHGPRRRRLGWNSTERQSKRSISVLEGKEDSRGKILGGREFERGECVVSCCGADNFD
jgi:hypothetical protein